MWLLKTGLATVVITTTPPLYSPPHTPKQKKKNPLPCWTRVAPNQLRLRSKFIASPWQHRGNKQQSLDRSWYLPDAQNSPPPPWLFPEGGVSGSQVHGKKSRVGVAFGPRKVGSAPPPSDDQRRGSSMPGPWSKGAGSGDEL